MSECHLFFFWDALICGGIFFEENNAIPNCGHFREAKPHAVLASACVSNLSMSRTQEHCTGAYPGFDDRLGGGSPPKGGGGGPGHLDMYDGPVIKTWAYPHIATVQKLFK